MNSITSIVPRMSSNMLFYSSQMTIQDQVHTIKISNRLFNDFDAKLKKYKLSPITYGSEYRNVQDLYYYYVIKEKQSTSEYVKILRSDIDPLNKSTVIDIYECGYPECKFTSKSSITWYNHARYHFFVYVCVWCLKEASEGNHPTHNDELSYRYKNNSNGWFAYNTRYSYDKHIKQYHILNHTYKKNVTVPEKKLSVMAEHDKITETLMIEEFFKQNLNESYLIDVPIGRRRHWISVSYEDYESMTSILKSFSEKRGLEHISDLKYYYYPEKRLSTRTYFNYTQSRVLQITKKYNKSIIPDTRECTDCDYKGNHSNWGCHVTNNHIRVSICVWCLKKASEENMEDEISENAFNEIKFDRKDRYERHLMNHCESIKTDN